MIIKLKKALILVGAWAFYSIVIIWGLFVLLLEGCSAVCYDEVVERVASPNGEQVAEITIGDCGGATTDFFGSVNVVSGNPELQGDKLFGFSGHPRESGLEVKWISDNELEISVSSLQKVRSINPTGRNTTKLKVTYTQRPQTTNSLQVRSTRVAH